MPTSVILPARDNGADGWTKQERHWGGVGTNVLNFWTCLFCQWPIQRVAVSANHLAGHCWQTNTLRWHLMGLLQSTNLSGACPLSELQVGPAHVHGVWEHSACAQRYSTAVTSAQQHTCKFRSVRMNSLKRRHLCLLGHFYFNEVMIINWLIISQSSKVIACFQGACNNS